MLEAVSKPQRPGLSDREIRPTGALRPLLACCVLVLSGAASADLPMVTEADPPPAFQRAPVEHPLADLVTYLASPAAHNQPPWKRTLARLALNKRPQYARVTAYCPRCGGSGTRWGTKTRPGIAAADPAYWGPGSIVWVGPPVGMIVTVEDTGGAVKGKHHFDVVVSTDHRECSKVGVRRNVVCVELYRAAPRSRWGRKPAGWHPPLPFEAFPILPQVPGQ